MKKNNGPKILLVDIETSPLEVFTWGIGEQHVALNQIIKDWSILSYAAKWLGEAKVMYMDTRGQKDVRDDKKVVESICKLLDQADYVVSHYGSKFDVPKIDTRRLKHRIDMFSMPKHEDTKTMANRYSFTSNKLEYIGKYLDIKHKKLVEKRKFIGMDLWKECLKKNPEAWKEMKLYNIQDIYALEDVYEYLKPRGSKINPSLFVESEEHVCVCGSREFKKNGFAYTSSGKYTRYKCKKCHRESRSKVNLLTPEQRKSLLVKT